MAPAEAVRLGIDDETRRLYVRIDNGKANMGPQGDRSWIRIATEHLANGEVVACVERWMQPKPFENVTTQNMLDCRKLAQEGRWRSDPRAANWFGKAIAQVLGLDISPGARDARRNRAKVNQILKIWLETKVLLIKAEADPDTRKTKKFIIPGPYNDPESSVVPGPWDPATVDDD
jgi:hypothetical protein